MLNIHQKQVTCLTYYKSEDNSKQRIVTSSLDGSVKIVDPVSFKVVHNFKFPDPILSVAISVLTLLYDSLVLQCPCCWYNYRDSLHSHQTRGKDSNKFWYLESTKEGWVSCTSPWCTSLPDSTANQTITSWYGIETCRNWTGQASTYSQVGSLYEKVWICESTRFCFDCNNYYMYEM